MDKGELLHEGKTKEVWSVRDQSDKVIISNKNDITKNDDPSQTEVMAGKAVMATATTCAIFQLLKDVGIPVAFEKQLDVTEFLSPKVKMIPLEIIWRRYAPLGSSFLKRRPDLTVSQGSLPHRFHSAAFELFLKTTGGVIVNQLGEQRGAISIDDPLIHNPYEEDWRLFHPKKPGWDEESDLGVTIANRDILPEGVSVAQIEDLLRRVGLVLEGAWAQLGCRLIDFKIEMGIAPNGQLMVADVIDADSWRLRDSEWQELSKQLFRDNTDMGIIEEKYALVANLVQRLRIPKQVIVLWRGSDQDLFPDFPDVAGVDVRYVTISGHKKPNECMGELENVLAEYPDGGVILACVGMSNGLGPTLAARTSWPVIGVPLTAGEFPDDVWSNLRMPSKVPMPTVLNPKNAVLAALNILSQKNPAAYAERQLRIEELDG